MSAGSFQDIQISNHIKSPQEKLEELIKESRNIESDLNKTLNQMELYLNTRVKQKVTEQVVQNSPIPSSPAIKQQIIAHSPLRYPKEVEYNNSRIPQISLQNNQQQLMQIRNMTPIKQQNSVEIINHQPSINQKIEHQSPINVIQRQQRSISPYSVRPQIIQQHQVSFQQSSQFATPQIQFQVQKPQLQQQFTPTKQIVYTQQSQPYQTTAQQIPQSTIPKDTFQIPQNKQQIPQITIPKDTFNIPPNTQQIPQNAQIHTHVRGRQSQCEQIMVNGKMLSVSPKKIQQRVVVNPPPKIIYNSNNNEKSPDITVEKEQIEDKNEQNDEVYLGEIMNYLYDELKTILLKQNTNEEDIDDQVKRIQNRIKLRLNMTVINDIIILKLNKEVEIDTEKKVQPQFQNSQDTCNLYNIQFIIEKKSVQA